jgi:hypothetical protein
LDDEWIIGSNENPKSVKVEGRNDERENRILADGDCAKRGGFILGEKLKVGGPTASLPNG